MIDEILSKTPCVQCDGSGATQVGEEDFEQCQFCWQLRYPFIEKTKQELLKAIKAAKPQARDSAPDTVTKQTAQVGVDRYEQNLLKLFGLEG